MALKTTKWNFQESGAPSELSSSRAPILKTLRKRAVLYGSSQIRFLDFLLLSAIGACRAMPPELGTPVLS